MTRLLASRNTDATPPSKFDYWCTRPKKIYYYYYYGYQFFSAGEEERWSSTWIFPSSPRSFEECGNRTGRTGVANVFVFLFFQQRWVSLNHLNLNVPSFLVWWWTDADHTIVRIRMVYHRYNKTCQTTELRSRIMIFGGPELTEHVESYHLGEQIRIVFRRAPSHFVELG